jgi:hypothetical protein
MADDGADRRKYSRLATGDVISIAPVDLPERLAVSTNVSSGGIRFEAVGCEIQFGDVFRVTFNIQDQTVVAVGRVVWGGSRVGVGSSLAPGRVRCGIGLSAAPPLATAVPRSFANVLTPQQERGESGSMPDFHQSGGITTLHRLGRPDVERLEAELLSYSGARPIALVLPCLYAEIRGPALKRIIEALGAVRYLRQVVVSVSGTRHRDEFEEMCALFEEVRTTCDGGATLIWTDGPRFQELYGQLRLEGLNPGGAGKGRGVWTAYGYVLAKNVARVIALHDCDVLEYRREPTAGSRSACTAA